MKMRRKSYISNDTTLTCYRLRYPSKSEKQPKAGSELDNPLQSDDTIKELSQPVTSLPHRNASPAKSIATIDKITRANYTKFVRKKPNSFFLLSRKTSDLKKNSFKRSEFGKTEREFSLSFLRPSVATQPSQKPKCVSRNPSSEWLKNGRPNIKQLTFSNLLPSHHLSASVSMIKMERSKSKYIEANSATHLRTLTRFLETSCSRRALFPRVGLPPRKVTTLPSFR